MGFAPCCSHPRTRAGSRRARRICRRCSRTTCTASARRRRTRCRWCGGTRTGARRSISWRASPTRRRATSSRWARCWPARAGRRAPTRRIATRGRCSRRCADASRSGCSTRCWWRRSSRRARTSGSGLLARGFARAGDGELADFYAALATAEERHAEIFIELARPLLPQADARRAHRRARRARGRDPRGAAARQPRPLISGGTRSHRRRSSPSTSIAADQSARSAS